MIEVKLYKGRILVGEKARFKFMSEKSLKKAVEIKEQT